MIVELRSLCGMTPRTECPENCGVQQRQCSSLWKEGYILFNDVLCTFYLWLHGIGHMVKDHSDSERGNIMGYSFLLTARDRLYASSHMIWLLLIHQAAVEIKIRNLLICFCSFVLSFTWKIYFYRKFVYCIVLSRYIAFFLIVCINFALLN